MGFHVGSLEATPVITFASILVVVLFIIFFDFFTKFLEYSLQESPRYNRMVQNIYKELMQMGIISFVFVLYQSIDAHGDANEWSSALDFSHILLFFVAIWYDNYTH